MNARKEMSLSDVAEGRTVKLVKVDAGIGLKSRLTAMGLLPNIQLTVIRNSQAGPFVINVRGSKLMLGRGMAKKIIVE